MCIFVYHCFYFVYYCKLCNLEAALRALTEPCMSRSPIVHCHFMLHFLMNEQMMIMMMINDDDDVGFSLFFLYDSAKFCIFFNIF